MWCDQPEPASLHLYHFSPAITLLDSYTLNQTSAFQSYCLWSLENHEKMFLGPKSTWYALCVLSNDPHTIGIYSNRALVFGQRPSAEWSPMIPQHNKFGNFSPFSLGKAHALFVGHERGRSVRSSRQKRRVLESLSQTRLGQRPRSSTSPITIPTRLSKNVLRLPIWKRKERH